MKRLLMCGLCYTGDERRIIYIYEVNYKLMCNMHVIKGCNFLESGVSRCIINSMETYVIENTCTLVKGTY